jgi:hypothetical protein
MEHPRRAGPTRSGPVDRHAGQHGRRHFADTAPAGNRAPSHPARADSRAVWLRGADTGAGVPAAHRVLRRCHRAGQAEIGDPVIDGGFYLDGYYLDAHYGPVPAALLELAATEVPTLRSLRAIIFEAVPESVASLGAPGVREVLQDLHDLAALQTPIADATPVPRLAVEDRPAGSLQATAEREYRLAAYTTRLSDIVPDGDPGATVLRHLTDQARLSLVTGTQAERLRWMLTHLGRARTDALLEEFLATCPVSSWPAEQGSSFARWFEDCRPTWDTASRIS